MVFAREQWAQNEVLRLGARRYPLQVQLLVQASELAQKVCERERTVLYGRVQERHQNQQIEQGCGWEW